MLFFCGGFPKSGTTMLQKCLNMHPEVSCQTEISISLLAESIHSLGINFNQNLIGLSEGKGLEAKPCNNAAFTTLFANALEQVALHRSDSEKIRGVSDNTFFIEQPDLLLGLIPNSKAISIVRNPIDVALSVWDWNQEQTRVFGDPRPMALLKTNGQLNFSAYAQRMVTRWRNDIETFLSKTFTAQNRLLILPYEFFVTAKYEALTQCFGHLNCSIDSELIHGIVENSTIQNFRSESQNINLFRKGRINETHTLNDEIYASIQNQLKETRILLQDRACAPLNW